MSRPSARDASDLEALESLAALNSAVADACGVLELRIRQAHRRALGQCNILKVLDPCRDEVQTIAVANAGIGQLVGRLLAERQAERSRPNTKGE